MLPDARGSTARGGGGPQRAAAVPLAALCRSLRAPSSALRTPRTVGHAASAARVFAYTSALIWRAWARVFATTSALRRRAWASFQRSR